MVRILIDVSDDMIKKINKMAAKIGVSRSEAVRQALQFWLAQKSALKTKNVFGILKGSKVDGLALQRRLRQEW